MQGPAERRLPHFVTRSAAVLAVVIVAVFAWAFFAVPGGPGTTRVHDRALIVGACLGSHPVLLDFQDGPTAAWYNVRCSDGSSHVVWISR